MNKLPFGIAAFMVLAAVSCTAPAQQTNETANWKTYSNSQFGFSFKYPENFMMEEYAREKDMEKPFTVQIINSAPIFTGSIAIINSPQPKIPLKNVSRKNITVGGVNTVYEVGQMQVESNLFRVSEVSLEHRGKKFYIVFGYGKPEQERIVEKILSTFTFTN